MPTVVIRNFPHHVHAELARRANASGQSLQRYLASELTRLTETPTVIDVLSRICGRSGGTVGLKQAVRDLRRNR